MIMNYPTIMSEYLVSSYYKGILLFLELFLKSTRQSKITSYHPFTVSIPGLDEIFDMKFGFDSSATLNDVTVSTCFFFF